MSRFSILRRLSRHSGRKYQIRVETDAFPLRLEKGDPPHKQTIQAFHVVRILN
jgi:hypothetical protein